MTQSTILAPGNTAATSTDVVIAAGDVAAIGIYSDAPQDLPPGSSFEIFQVTPGEPNYIGSLKNNARSTILSGPGTYNVARRAVSGAEFGVFKDI